MRNFIIFIKTGVGIALLCLIFGTDIAGAFPTAQQSTTTISGGDGAFSLELPEDWVFEDQLESAGVFAYGDSDDSMQSRLDSANPDTATTTTITGSGGLIFLYTPEVLGFEDEGSVDLDLLIDQVMDNLESQGFVIVGEPESIELEDGTMVYVMATGLENGYVALAMGGGLVAFVTATGDSQTFKTDRELLFTILQSLHMPAADEVSVSAEEPTPTEESETTPQPRATATASGGGGRIVPLQTATPGQSGGRIVPVLPTATPAS